MSHNKVDGDRRRKKGAEHNVPHRETKRDIIALSPFQVDAPRLGGGRERFRNADDAQSHGNRASFAVLWTANALFPNTVFSFMLVLFPRIIAIGISMRTLIGRNEASRTLAALLGAQFIFKGV